MNSRCASLTSLVVATFTLLAAISATADSLTWNTNQNVVSAELHAVPLLRLLESVSKATDWQVYLEANTVRNVSTTFKDLPPGDALRMLLGNLNYAIVPQTNARTRLYVFRTSQGNATQLIQPGDLIGKKPAKSGAIPNELIVRLKPGASIDELARKLGAKVIGKIDGQNIYRLQFEDEAAANAARNQLSGNSDVASVESNYYVDAPPESIKVNASGSPVQLKLNPPADVSGRVIVGLVDTAVQPLGSQLDSFLLKSLSVADQPNLDSTTPTHGTSMFENILRAASSAEGNSASFQVVSVDVYGSSETTSTFNVAQGLVAAINNGANPVNLSLGSPNDSQLLHDIIQQAAQRGIQIYAAAGNNASSQPFYPAAYPEVTAVTAGTQPGQLAPYANYGPYVRLMAPGASLTYYGSSVFLVNGTSTATAFITGLTAGIADSHHTTISGAASIVGSTPSFQYSPSH